MEEKWNQKRKAIEQQFKESLEEQASIQASLMAYKTDNARIEFQLIKQEMTTANQVLEDIREQSREQIEQNGQLQAILANIIKLKREIREEANNLKRAKIETKAETRNQKNQRSTGSSKSDATKHWRRYERQSRIQ